MDLIIFDIVGMKSTQDDINMARIDCKKMRLTSPVLVRVERHDEAEVQELEEGEIPTEQVRSQNEWKAYAESLFLRFNLVVNLVSILPRTKKHKEIASASFVLLYCVCI